MKRPRAMAFDLDGTLAESKQRVSADMGILLGELLKDTPVAVMSGASFAQFQTQFFPALPEESAFAHLYIFPENAGQCFILRDAQWRSQYDHTFSPSQKEEVMRALQEALKKVGLETPPPQIWGERVEDRGAQISFSPLGQQAPVAAKEEWRLAHEPVRKELENVLLELLPNFSVAAGGITTIDITQKGINKAYGMERFSELSHVAIPDMLYVGDALGEGGNDAVVLQTGVPTYSVFNPEETAVLIETVLKTPIAGQ